MQGSGNFGDLKCEGLGCASSDGGAAAACWGLVRMVALIHSLLTELHTLKIPLTPTPKTEEQNND